MNAFKELAEARGHEFPEPKPLPRKVERVAIAVIAAFFVAVTVLAFVLENPRRTGIGWFLGAFGVAIVGALIWGHRRGNTDRPPPAPAPDPAVVLGDHRLAPVRARLVAGLLDQALMFLPLLVLILLRDSHLVPQPAFTGLVVLAFAIWIFGQACWLWVTNGSTPGRRLLGMRVVCAGGKRMTLWCALRRELGGLGGSGLLEGAKSLASMSVDDLRRSSADRRGGTLVVGDDR